MTDRSTSRPLIDLWRLHSDPDPDANRRRERLQERARLGQAIGRPPYGYGVGEDGRYEIDEEEAAVVRRIFSLCLRDGTSASDGSRNASMKKAFRLAAGATGAMVSIRDLLRNPVYIGPLRQARRQRAG